MRTKMNVFQRPFWSRAVEVMMITLLLLAIMPVSSVFATTIGFFSPAKATTNGRGWANLNNAFTSDNLYTTAKKNNKQLRLSNFNITAIPGGSTIDGIEITVEGLTTGGQANVALAYSGTNTYTTGGSGVKTTTLTSSESTVTLGGPTEKWGHTWAASDFTNANLGAKLTTTGFSGSTNTISVDQVRVKVYFTPANTTLVLSPVSGNYGGTASMSATLTETSTGNPIANETVTFSLNGSSVGTDLTDSAGVAVLPSASLSGITAGDYPYGAGASFAGAGAYQATSITADLRVNGTLTTLTVTPASGTYTGASGSGTVDLSATLTETVSGTPLSGQTIDFTLGGMSVGSGTTNSSGVASVSGASLAGYDAGTYASDVEASFAGSGSNEASTGSGALTVNPVTLTVSGGLTISNKTYDGNTTTTLTVGSPSLVGVIGSPLDDVTLDTSAAAGAFSDKNVGTSKTVQISGLTLSGADAGNYTLTQPTRQADITARALTVSATGVNKTYNGTTAATATLSTDKVSGDTVTTNYTASFADKNIGTGKSVGVSSISISGTDAGNYSLSNTTASTSADITARTLTVSTTGVNKTYDGTTAATVTLSTDKVSGDVVTPSYTGAAFADKNIGTGKSVGVTGISISGADAGNYSLSNTTASTSADITARTLTVSATGTNKVYDSTTAATVTLSTDKVSGDVVTPSYTGAAFDSANVGTGKTVTVSGISISGADAGNYSLSSTSASTSADITAAATVTTITSDSPDPANIGQSIAINVSITSPGGTPTGTVDILEGTTTLCSIASLSSGSGSCNVTFNTIGTHTIKAVYAGDTNFSTSTSANEAHTALGHTLSGNAGVAGATLSYFHGTLKTAVADSNGNYTLEVPVGWSGTVTPSVVDTAFTPASKSYTNVTSNQTAQDYRRLFSSASKWTSAFDLSHGWTVSSYVRTVGDVNGDGADDLVGFGQDGVYIALATGSGFGSASKWTSAFDQSHGWTVSQHVRTVGDVNGDGVDDLVGFGQDGVYVALSTGSGFGPASKWTSAFDQSHGWTVSQYVRTVGDVNGDGKDDVVGFGQDGVYIALSTGSGFGSASKWTSAFDQSHGWTVSDYVRTVGDINGDGKADIVGFGQDGVYIALSTGSGFGSASKWVSAFDLSHGWTVSSYVRTVGDVNGDGVDDLVGFGQDGVYVAK